MIVSFTDKATRDIYFGKDNKRTRKLCPKELHTKARKKLVLIDQDESLKDLRHPGNDLKQIEDKYQIRINKKYRVRFSWCDGEARYVQINNFHD